MKSSSILKESAAYIRGFMIRICILLLLTMTFAHAQVGEVRSVRHAKDGWLMRKGARLNLTEGISLQVGDNIHTENSQATLLLYPKIQICLAKGSEFTLTQHLLDDDNEKTTSIIDLIKGLLRIQINKEGGEKMDQTTNARFASFGARGTEYEVSSTNDKVELDVVEGEVMASSPNVKTPALVKPNQGLSLTVKESQFTRRPLIQHIQDTGFLSRDEVRDRWEKGKAERAMKKLEKERNNGLKDKKLENVKDKVENLLNRREDIEEE